MKKIILLLIILLLLVGAAYFVFRDLPFFSMFSTKKAIIHNNTIALEIADTDVKREKGLSDRASLSKDKGMLFIFKNPGYPQFWMKNMRFPIDMIFLSGNKVVTIYANVQPTIEQDTSKTENLILYTPTQPANRLLELNAGQAQKYNLQVGDVITLQI